MEAMTFHFGQQPTTTPKMLLMLNYILLFVIASTAIQTQATETPAVQGTPTSNEGNWRQISGEATNGLQPNLLILKEAANWSFEIDYIAQTNFPENTWLKVTNRVGSKLELLLDGKKIQLNDAAALAAMSLPAQTTVSNIMKTLHHREHPWLWLRFGSRSPIAGESAAATTFDLKQAFGISFTNNVVLQLTPLLYRVDSNIQTARLVEFPPIKLKLLSNGDVKKE